MLKGKRICIKESSSEKLMLHPWSIQRFSLSTYYLGIVQCYIILSILYSTICLKYYYFQNEVSFQFVKEFSTMDGLVFMPPAWKTILISFHWRRCTLQSYVQSTCSNHIMVETSWPRPTNDCIALCFVQLVSMTVCATVVFCFHVI